ncbi:progesterone receptor-like [Conger conger]|uniref:progesterone receptor-like n=1 Tax=Conger conger TaxID=82655 RepID=UPI002A59897C|nr:progesterone receptor-like [Conger conger]
MDNKRTDKMESLFTPATESPPPDADSIKRARHLIKTYSESFGSYVEGIVRDDSNDIQSLSSVPVSMRNFGNMDALSFSPGSGNDGEIWKDFVVGGNSMMRKDSYGHVEISTKADNLVWATAPFSSEEAHAKGTVTLAATVPKENFSRTLNTSSVSGICIKDEQVLLKMEPQTSDFCPYTANIPNLNPCYLTSTASTQQLAYGEQPETLAHSSPPTQKIVLDTTRYSAEISSDNPLPQSANIKTDPCGSFSSFVGEGILTRTSMGYPQQALQTLPVLKSEPFRLSISSAPADSSFWCQSTCLSEDHHPIDYLSPAGLHNTKYSSMHTYSSYLGALPHRVCAICADEASGCHYGVLTCGSCKVFFKRAVEGHHNYLCAGRNDCIVDKIRRKNCPACRLRKCYQAGMILGGRKLKKLGALKAAGLTQALVAYPLAPPRLSGDSQALMPLGCPPGVRELHLSPHLISVLESIEPEVVYSGYDNSQPDMPNILLNSLNRLCERQLLRIVKWSKSLPGFRSLHINDQMALIQYSWMSLMVFSLGWRSFQNVTSEYLYFAPDLILNEEYMRRSPICDLCLAMQFIPQEFANLQVTKEEFLCMKVLLLLNTVPLEGLKSQSQFDEMRQSYIHELTKAIQLRENGMVACSQRFYHLTKLMDHMHDIVKKLHLYCLSTFIQADAMRVEFPEMMSEVIASQLPRVLAGMVKPLLFHTK